MLGLVLRYNNALWSGVPRSELAELWGFPVEAAGSSPVTQMNKGMGIAYPFIHFRNKRT